MSFEQLKVAFDAKRERAAKWPAAMEFFSVRHSAMNPVFRRALGLHSGEDLEVEVELRAAMHPSLWPPSRDSHLLAAAAAAAAA